MDKKNLHKILIVEDEDDIRSVYAEMLKGEGYEVLEAGNGAAALTVARVEPWDLMILDIMLPGEDGMHILKTIKESDSTKDKPVILLTNLSNDSYIHQCFGLGAASYLVKSQVTPGDLIAEVKNYLKS